MRGVYFRRTGYDPARVSALVEIRGLSVEFRQESGPVRAVRGIDLDVPRGRTLGLVGESGSGKTSAALSIPRLLATRGRIAGGSILWRASDEAAPIDLAALESGPLRRVRGKQIGVVFQEPASALNPVYTVGEQIAESAREHLGMSKRDAHARAVEWLGRVGIPAAALRADDYPHALSGGMRQRVTIAMALVAEPKLLIADEPTASLDVTVQAQILDLLRDLQRERGLSALVVTHDLGVVAELADEIAVMYAGQVVERGPAEEILRAPSHPYTIALLAAESALPLKALPKAVPGQVPDPADLPRGCAFHPRCPEKMERCAVDDPPPIRIGQNRDVRCWARVPQEPKT